ncbi:hypothetical protein MLD38_007684 [Melastoma candidum]|uniref:Uncharacterized protein n=1 Tax=Melastoma candidum TaxID=119954 RepID=A0ACB9RTS8_9MYRT|nr:hypothetical protein MLD38_007684 [Melastoma candidum]
MRPTIPVSILQLSPALRRELANLDKDAASRKSAMNALKLYVKKLDSKDGVSGHSEDPVLPVPFALDSVGSQGDLCNKRSRKKTNFFKLSAACSLFL